MTNALRGEQATREPAARGSESPTAGGRGSVSQGWLRWSWRRLTSMRTAIVLLVLLALAAVPGTVLPQRGVATNPAAVPLFMTDHPDVSPWLDRLQLFDVYASVWFAAIYVLLLISMTGCVVPRCRKLWRESRAAPPAAPRRLRTEQGHQQLEVRAVDDALSVAETHLRRRRYRVVRTLTEVRAERGRSRELGNLVFHLSLLILLFGVAGGRLFGYEGRVAVTEGNTFTNVAGSYDALSPAPWADLNQLEPMSFVLEDFVAEFETAGTRVGEPREFAATMRQSVPGRVDEEVVVRPNQPLDVEGTKFFLTGHGYAPEITVRDSSGAAVAEGATIFLPSDANFLSDGVVKAAGATPEPVALKAVFAPTAVATADRALVSAFPGLVDPQLQVTAYTGDLGLGSGRPQSVFALDFTDLSAVTGADGTTWSATLSPGQTVSLPDGRGSVTFDGVSRFANFQVARDPGKELSLLAAVLLLLGLTASLSIARRRIWVRVAAGGGVELAGRSLSRRDRLDVELRELAAAIGAAEQSSLDPRELPPGKEPA